MGKEGGRSYMAAWGWEGPDCWAVGGRGVTGGCAGGRLGSGVGWGVKLAVQVLVRAGGAAASGGQTGACSQVARKIKQSQGRLW